MKANLTRHQSGREELGNRSGWSESPRKLSLLLVTALVSLTAIAAFSQVGAGTDFKRRADTKLFMRMKMAWSDGVLEGLALEKFEMVSQNAIRMRNMTQSNMWFVMRQPEYLVQTTNFQKSADALYMAAVDKNLDASTEAYVNVMKNCVECHRLVRVDQRKNLKK